MGNNITKYILLIFCCWCAFVANAAEFIASVENKNVSDGQSLQLKLEIVDAKATDSIDLSELSKDFTIYHKQQYSSYTNTNGTVRSEQGWYVTLLPKNMGEITIPVFSINTNKGVLHTEPFTVHVGTSANANIQDKDSVDISLVATVSKAKSYVNETLIYTLKIISYQPIYNIAFAESLKSEEVFIEKVGETRYQKRNDKGATAQIIELHYAITGMKSGKAKISPAVMTGELQIPKNHQRYSLLSGVFFDNMFEIKPFSIRSEQVTIDIQPAVGSVKDWMPLNNLILTQSFDDNTEVRVGETITRKIKMIAEGGLAKTLPSTKDLQQIPNVKIYANKPVFTDKYNESKGVLVGSMEEELSFVPQTEGNITLPEITIKWWNVKRNKLEYSSLPAKTFKVLKATANNPNVTLDFSQGEENQVVEHKSDSPEIPAFIYIIMGFMATIICALIAILLVFVYKKRHVKVSTKKTQRSASAIQIITVTDLREYILQYAAKNWLTRNVTINTLGQALLANNYTYNIELYTTLTEYINAAIYADLAIDLSVLTAQWENFKSSVIKNKQTTKRDRNKIRILNPT